MISHRMGIVSEYCAPGCPKRFVFRLSASMRSREVPAERSERLHLVNLPCDERVNPCRMRAIVDSDPDARGRESRFRLSNKFWRLCCP